MDFRSLPIRRLEKFLVDNSPAILTGIGSAGIIASAFFTAQATIKAVRIVDKAQEDREEDGLAPLTSLEISRLVWRLYIPPALTTVSSVACVIFSQRVSDRRTAALAAVYKISEEAYERYRAGVVSKLGEKREDIIRAEVAKKHVDSKPGVNEVVFIGSGEVLCFDAYTGRYFRSDIETIRQVQNNLNCGISSGGSCVSLSTYYEAIGLAPTAFSDDVGWNLDRMVDIRFSSILVEEKPCVYVEFNVAPIKNYDRLG
jgi:hypothetical protein